MAMFYALLALCLAGSALGQITSPGGCPRVQVPKNLVASKLMGRWFEAEAVYANFELAAKCNTVDYSPGKNSSIIVVDSYISGVTGDRFTYDVTIHVPDPKRNPGKMLIKFPLTVDGAISNQWILGTDYDNFAIVYSCTNWGKYNLMYLWILTRERIPDQSVLDKAYKAIDKNRIPRKNLLKVDQENCEEDDDEEEDDCEDED